MFLAHKRLIIYFIFIYFSTGRAVWRECVAYGPARQEVRERGVGARCHAVRRRQRPAPPQQHAAARRRAAAAHAPRARCRHDTPITRPGTINRRGVSYVHLARASSNENQAIGTTKLRTTKYDAPASSKWIGNRRTSSAASLRARAGNGFSKRTI